MVKLLGTEAEVEFVTLHLLAVMLGVDALLPKVIYCSRCGLLLRWCLLM